MTDLRSGLRLTFLGDSLLLKRLFLSSLFSARFQDRPILLLLWTEEPERASSSCLRSPELISRLTFIKLGKMTSWVSEKK